MIYLLVHEPYKNSYSWVTRRQLIYAEARKKRCQIVEISCVDEIPQSDPTPLLCVRSAAKYWLEDVVEQANRRNIHTVVMVNLPPDHNLNCSVISDDLEQNTLLAIDYLLSLGKKSIALFGVNSTVYSGLYRAKVFSQYLNTDEGIYYIDKSFTSAYKDFLANIDRYDSVIVCNSATAVAMSLTLKDYINEHPDFSLLSFGKLLLLDYLHPSITTIDKDTLSSIRLLFSLYELVKKFPRISCIDIRLKGELCVRDSTQNRLMEGYVPLRQNHSYPKYNPYLQDQRISEVISVESMLLQCDSTDLDIINGLLTGHTYQQLADQLFLSLNTVKYRVKQLQKKCLQPSLSALRTTLKRYFTQLSPS